MLSGDNGLLNRAGQAKNDSVVGQEKESVELAYISVAVKKLGNDVTEGELQTELDSSVGNEKTDVSTNDDNTLNVYFTDTEHNYTVDNGSVTTATNRVPIVTTPPTTAVTEYTKYKDTNNDVAMIPTGFRVSDNTEEQTIENGLVVIDSSNNQWVWIPVNNVADMYEYSAEEIAITGGPSLSIINDVNTTLYSKSEIIDGTTRGLPNLTSSNYREPDILIGSGTQYDYANYSTAGFTSLQNMAQNLVDDYKEMIASVGKYKGFYVGRYELTGSVTNPTELPGTTLRKKDWYTLYKVCKNFTVDEIVESRMIWGCQWDMIMNWMLNSNDTGIQAYVTNSNGKGNYSKNISNTGSNSSYKINNIFDLAGNCSEWTQEAYSTNFRCCRGGGINSFATSSSASIRGYSDPTLSSYNAVSTRPIIYMK